MHLFYTPGIEGNKITLPEIESIHCTKVLRLEKGALIQLIDGKGGFYKARITQTQAKKCEVEIIESESGYGKKNYYVHIAVAPTKNIDRIEWFIEKSTEIGIDEISFLQCTHSERKQINLERLEKIAVSAMKQSLKAYLPKINEMQKFDAFIKNPSLQKNKFIAHLSEDRPISLKNSLIPNEDYCVLIGPEGDFSMEEIKAASSLGFQTVGLGTSRLRTETAAFAACHLCNLANE